MPFYNISIVITVTMTQIYFSEILQLMFIHIYCIFSLLDIGFC